MEGHCERIANDEFLVSRRGRNRVSRCRVYAILQGWEEIGMNEEIQLIRNMDMA